MSVSTLQSDELARAIRLATRRAGVSVGTRLRSERTLAQTLQIPHARVRQAFRSLVEEGILVQRHGSGTYLHRLPEHEAEPEPSFTLETQELFHPRSPQRNAGRHAAGLLDLGLWWEELAVMSPVQQQVLAAMVSAVESAGHRLSLHSADYRGTRERVEPAVIAERVRQHPRDGYLVSAFIASNFEAVRQPDWPVVYFASTSKAMIPEPSVTLDAQAGIEFALTQMRAGGCRRIAMVAHGIGRDDTQDKRYEAVTALVGQSYRRFACVQLTPDEVASATLELLSAEPRPDGLYVADQHLLPGVRTALTALDLTPGRDVAVVVHKNHGMPLAGARGVAWSCVEFDLQAYAHAAVEKLVQVIHHGDQRRGHLAIRPQWGDGDTHVIHSSTRSGDTSQTHE